MLFASQEKRIRTGGGKAEVGGGRVQARNSKIFRSGISQLFRSPKMLCFHLRPKLLYTPPRFIYALRKMPSRVKTAARKKGQSARVAKVKQYTGNSTVQEVALGDPWKPMTDQQKRFVKAYASGENMTNSLKAGGFSESSLAYGYRLLEMPNVARALKEQQAAYALASELSKKDVMDMLKEAYDMAKLMSEPSSMVAAAREIGKMCGYYEPKKVDLTISTTGRKKIELLTDEELFKLMEEAGNEVLALEHEADDGQGG